VRAPVLTGDRASDFAGAPVVVGNWAPAFAGATEHAPASKAAASHAKRFDTSVLMDRGDCAA
jgi:hypothetical protein